MKKKLNFNLWNEKEKNIDKNIIYFTDKCNNELKKNIDIIHTGFFLIKNIKEYYNQCEINKINDDLSFSLKDIELFLKENIEKLLTESLDLTDILIKNYIDNFSIKDKENKNIAYSTNNTIIYNQSYEVFFESKKLKIIIQENISIISYIEKIIKNSDFLKNSININNIYPSGFKEFLLIKKCLDLKRKKIK